MPTRRGPTYRREVHRAVILLLALVTLSAGACSDGRGPESASPSSPTAPTSAAPSPTSSSGAAVSSSIAPVDRRYEVVSPTGIDGEALLPLVVLLHGYASSGAEIAAYLGLAPLAQQRGFLLVAPDGSADPRGNRFWDATDACCNFTGAPVDDVGYLSDVIADVEAEYPVDPARVYLVGHSNGGFMAYRMACGYGGDIAAVVSIAGATFADPAECAPRVPLSVLQIHGDADGTISYSGGSFPAVYPGAPATQQIWRDYNDCGPGVTAPPPPIDLEANLPGPESTISFSDCANGAAVDLWTIAGGGHIPTWSPSFATQVVDWLYDHPSSG